MAFGIAGHHSGLMDSDGLGARDPNGRLIKELEPRGDWRDHAMGLPTAADLQDSIGPPRANAIDQSFSAAFLPRMVFVALVAADFLGTHRFQWRPFPARRHRVPLRLARCRTVRCPSLPCQRVWSKADWMPLVAPGVKQLWRAYALGEQKGNGALIA